MSDELAARLDLATAISREAGNATLRYFGRDNYSVEWKRDASPVTIADREAEQLLRQRITAAFPDDGILGEEFGEQPGTSGFRWIVDPIDGTKSFVAGVPLYGTLVGVERDRRAVVGAVYIPPLGEMVYAASGQGAWHVRGDDPPRTARVSEKSSLGEGLFCTTDVKGFTDGGRMPVYDRLQAAARVVRTWGDCYGYVLVATGRAELMVDPKMNVWDCAALQPVMEEAGGTFTDWRGMPTIYGGEALATNARVLEETLRLVRG